jgi:TolA-binding protein
MKLILLPLIVSFVFIGCSRPGAEEMFNRGVEAQKAEQYDSAIDSYWELIRAYPDSVRTPEAYYAIATIYQNQKKSYHEAIQVFRQVVDKFPNHATAPSSSFLIGFIYNNDLKNVDSARIAYQDFIIKYPTNQLVGSAQFELANLGKSPDDILKEQTKAAQNEAKQTKKGKRK